MAGRADAVVAEHAVGGVLCLGLLVAEHAVGGGAVSWLACC